MGSPGRLLPQVISRGLHDIVGFKVDVRVCLWWYGFHALLSKARKVLTWIQIMNGDNCVWEGECKWQSKKERVAQSSPRNLTKGGENRSISSTNRRLKEGEETASAWITVRALLGKECELAAWYTKRERGKCKYRPTIILFGGRENGKREREIALQQKSTPTYVPFVLLACTCYCYVSKKHLEFGLRKRGEKAII